MNKDILTFQEDKHCYFLNGIPMAGVSGILKKCGLIDLSGIPPEVLKRAADFGTAVHKVCELHDKGTLDIKTISEPLIPYYQAYSAFLNDYKPDMVEIESPVYSKKFWMAGKPDRIVSIKDKIVCYDIKSTASIMPTVRLQLAGYVIAYCEMHQCKGIERWCLQLKKDGTYKVEAYSDLADIQVFQACCTVSKWSRKNITEK